MFGREATWELDLSTLLWGEWTVSTLSNAVAVSDGEAIRLTLGTDSFVTVFGLKLIDLKSSRPLSHSFSHDV